MVPNGIEVDFTRHFALVSEAMGRVGLTEALAIERDPRLLEDIVRRECQVGVQDMDAEATLEAWRGSWALS